LHAYTNDDMLITYDQEKPRKQTHMKKIIALLIIGTFVFSCQEETRAKVKDAGKAVGAEVKIAAQKTKAKVGKYIDTAKVKQKANKIIVKGAEAIEKGAKKVKESANKK
jgi:hypothetical protein